MKINKIILLVMIMFIIFNITLPSYAESVPVIFGPGSEGEGSPIAPSGTSGGSSGGSSGGNFNLDAFDSGTPPASINNLANNTMGTIISVIRVVGVGIAVVMIMAIAMKYMLAAPGDRADIKKHAVPFVIGAVVLFGTSQILGIILNFAETIS